MVCLDTPVSNNGWKYLFYMSGVSFINILRKHFSYKGFSYKGALCNFSLLRFGFVFFSAKILVQKCRWNGHQTTDHTFIRDKNLPNSILFPTFKTMTYKIKCQHHLYVLCWCVNENDLHSYCLKTKPLNWMYFRATSQFAMFYFFEKKPLEPLLKSLCKKLSDIDKNLNKKLIIKNC